MTAKTTQNIIFPAMLNTEAAAQALGRTTQTLRLWACKGSGPLQPIRISRGGPLAWRGEDILRILNGEAPAETEAESRG